MADTDVQVTKDEADKRQFDGLELVDRDPNFHYRYARKKDMNIARHKFRGYEVVDSATDKVRSVLDDSTRMKKATDTSTMVEVSDMVLMRIPKDKHEQIMRDREAKIKRMTRAVTGTYKSAVDKISRGAAFEEHKDNPAMRGPSEREFEAFLKEQRDRRK